MLKHLFKNVVYGLVRWLPVRGAVVLMYHSVGDNSAFFTVPPAEFERQMAYLAKNQFNVISAAELLEILKNGEKAPQKTVVVTIDDGYKDNFTEAFPILKKYNLPASIFVVTGNIGWSRTTTSGVTIPMLNWDEIKEMNASGLMDFYPHTDTHPQLDFLPKEQVEKEITDSKLILESELNKKTTIFAYPFGRYTEEAMDVLKKNGFVVAFTVKKGRVGLGDNPFLLKRNSVDSKVSFSMFKGIVRFGRI